MRACFISTAEFDTELVGGGRVGLNQQDDDLIARGDMPVADRRASLVVDRAGCDDLPRPESEQDATRAILADLFSCLERFHAKVSVSKDKARPHVRDLRHQSRSRRPLIKAGSGATAGLSTDDAVEIVQQGIREMDGIQHSGRRPR